MNEHELVTTINSCSGGMTSSYMYLKFPTDLTLFSFVASDIEQSPENKISDPGVLRAVQTKVKADVRGTMEREDTLKALLKLEQIGGREIIWTYAGYSYEELVLGQVNLPKRKNKMLPNSRFRFCTEYLKVLPIFEWCYNFAPGIVLMNIGFRADEPNRVKKADDCRMNTTNFSNRCDIEGRFQGKHRWIKKHYWREVSFPLYSAGVVKKDVQQRMAKYNLPFPTISNCVGCFFHTAAELREQERMMPGSLAPWKRLEDAVGATFKSGISIKEILEGRNPDKATKGSCFCKS